MTQLPVMRAEAILSVDRMTGKFQGQMAPTTPRGGWVAMILTFSSSCCTWSSRACLAVRGD